jgi:putative aldouronate transport system substrate-binding protein
MTPLTEQAAPEVPGYDLRFATPFGGGKMVTLSSVTAGPAVKKSEKSMLALKLLDYLLSPSGAELMTLGLEGENYNKKGEEYEYIGFEGKLPAVTELEDKYGMFVTGTYMRIDPRSSFFKLSEREQEATDLMVNKEGGGFWPLDPYLAFTPEESETLNPILIDLTKSAEEFATKFLLEPDSGDDDWNEWMAKAESIGLSKALEILNAAQARYDSGK